MPLITAQEVVQLSFSEDKNFRHAKIKEALIRAAQEKWMRPVLGEQLYHQLVNDLKNNALSSSNKTLLDDYLKPALAYYVKYLVLPDLARPVTNKGPQEVFGQNSRSAGSSDVKGLQTAAKVVAEALTDTMTRFIELNQKDFEIYAEGNNVRKRIGIAGGVIVRKKKYKETVYTNIPQGLPNVYIFTQTASSDEWAFSYAGKLKNEGVQVGRILDSAGNDITDYANILVNSDNETVLITFSNDAWLNEGDKSGMVELYTAMALQEANLLRAFIDIDNGLASLEVTEGEVSEPTYKWYIGAVLQDGNGNTLDLSTETGEGYVRCEVWSGGTKQVSVFERFDLVNALQDDDGFVLQDDDGIILH